MRHWFLKPLRFLVVLSLFPFPGNAADSPYFAGKTIRIIVGFKPGGGTDLQARYFASGWSKFIPGNPKVIVSNLPPNIAATNYLSKAKPDGLTLEFRASGPVTTQHDKRAQFKARELRWIGVHAARDLIWLVRGNAPYLRIEECRTKQAKQPLLMTARDIENLSGKWLSAMTLARWFGCSLKVTVVGRLGTADDLLMLERGETQSMLAGSEWYAIPRLRPGWIRERFMVPFANLSHPETPAKPNAEAKMDLPNVAELLNSEQRKIWESVHLADVYVGKGIVAPPGTADDLLAILRKAYEDALSDSDFRSGLEKIMGQPANLIRGPRLEELTRQYDGIFRPDFEKQLRQEALDYIDYKK